MSEDNVALVLRTFDAFKAGGFDAKLEFFAPDVVWHPIPGWIEDAEYRGHDGVRKMSALFTDNFVDLKLEPHEVREIDDRVLVLVDSTGKSRHDGVPIEMKPSFLYWNLRQQKIGDVRFFLSWDEGVQALDASEPAGSRAR